MTAARRKRSRALQAVNLDLSCGRVYQVADRRKAPDVPDCRNRRRSPIAMRRPARNAANTAGRSLLPMLSRNRVAFINLSRSGDVPDCAQPSPKPRRRAWIATSSPHG